MTLNQIEEELKQGQVHPGRLAELSDFLAGTSSRFMEEELQLQILYVEFFKDNRDHVKSDNAVQMFFNTTDKGKRQMELENFQKRIKILMMTIGRHLRVAELQARNLV